MWIYPTIYLVISILCAAAFVCIIKMGKGNAGLSADALRVLRAMPADETASSRVLAILARLRVDRVKVALAELRARGFVSVAAIRAAKGGVAGRGYRVTSTGRDVRR